MIEKKIRDFYNALPTLYAKVQPKKKQTALFAAGAAAALAMVGLAAAVVCLLGKDEPENEPEDGADE